MRSTDNIALELLAKDLRVAALNAARHGLAYKGERLMTVEASQFDDLAVQLKAVIGELCFPETETAGVFIQ